MMPHLVIPHPPERLAQLGKKQNTKMEAITSPNQTIYRYVDIRAGTFTNMSKTQNIVILRGRCE